MYVQHVNKFRGLQGISYWEFVAKIDAMQALKDRDRMLRYLFGVSTWADIALEMDAEIKISILEAHKDHVKDVGLDGATKAVVYEAIRAAIKSEDFLAVYSDSKGDMVKVAAHFKVDVQCAEEHLVILKNIGHEVPRFSKGIEQAQRISLAAIANLAELCGLKKADKVEVEVDHNANSLSMREEMTDIAKIAAMAGLRKKD